MVPAHAPEKGEPWEEVMKDIERVIMPGVTHWHHPQVGTLAPSTGRHTGTIHR